MLILLFRKINLENIYIISCTIVGIPIPISTYYKLIIIKSGKFAMKM